MLDIGANIGTTTIPRIVAGDFQKAYAVEAEWLDFSCLVHNVHANRVQGLVFPDYRAIFSFTGSVKFLVEDHSGTHRVVTGERARWKGQDVPCMTLDDWTTWCGVDAGDVDFVKCDVEGSEGHVLEGATELLALRNAVWQLEYAPHRLRGLGTTQAMLMDTVGHWFTHFVILGKGGKGLQPTIRPIQEITSGIESLGLGEKGFTNILLYPSDPR